MKSGNRVRFFIKKKKSFSEDSTVLGKKKKSKTASRMNTFLESNNEQSSHKERTQRGIKFQK